MLTAIALGIIAGVLAMAMWQLRPPKKISLRYLVVYMTQSESGDVQTGRAIASVTGYKPVFNMASIEAELKSQDPDAVSLFITHYTQITEEEFQANASYNKKNERPSRIKSQIDISLG